MKSSNLLVTLTAALALHSASLLAQPAVYRDGEMRIPSGAVITNNRQAYYDDIVLSADSSGKLSLVSATRLPLVGVDSVEADAPQGQQSVTLTIKGYKSVPCVELQEAAVSRKESTFTVLLAESVLGPAESCIAVIDPFELSLPLDVSDLGFGTYLVEVNGVQTSFELTTILIP